MAFGRTKENPTPASTSATESAGGLTAFIDQGSEFEGKLSFKETVRIDGTFTGEIASENTLIVGETGEIAATIRSRSVMVSGTVEGDIIATRQLVLHKTAKLQGNVETPSLVIEEGATFNGGMKMMRPEVAAKKSAEAPAKSEPESGSSQKN